MWKWGETGEESWEGRGGYAGGGCAGVGTVRWGISEGNGIGEGKWREGERGERGRKLGGGGGGWGMEMGIHLEIGGLEIGELEIGNGTEDLVGI